MKTSNLFDIEIKRLRSMWDKSKGLLLSDGKTGAFFQTRFGIHTFGMKFPIDVLILNGEKKVEKLAANVMPNRFFFWNPRYCNVVELPAGTISKHKIKKGTSLLLSCFKT
jgi:uncharacterized protein